MRSFDDVFALAASRKGGPQALEKLLFKPKSNTQLKKIGDDRWLSEMTKCVFRAGFVWRVVENKWPDFETVFQRFDPHAVAYLSDEAIAELLVDPRVIRHHTKLLATRENANFVLELAAEYGSAAAFFADYSNEDYVGLLDRLKRGGSRLGGTSGQYFLRSMGKDSFILSRDVVAALVREGVVDKAATSKRDLAAAQSAFNRWREQSGRSLTEISRVLAMSIES